MKTGFTSTQTNMTPAQFAAFKQLIMERTGLESFHHGDCVGADKRAHQFVRTIPGVWIVRYPATVAWHKRANCDDADETRSPRPPLERNHHIVDDTDQLVATPKEMHEVLRSGTWATIRYARKQKKPIAIIYPDGTVSLEHA